MQPDLVSCRQSSRKMPRFEGKVCDARCRGGAEVERDTSERDTLCPSRSRDRCPCRGRPVVLSVGYLARRGACRHLVSAVAVVSGIQIMMAGCHGLVFKPHSHEIGNGAFVPPLRHSPQMPGGFVRGAGRSPGMPAFFWRSANPESTTAGNASKGWPCHEKQRQSFICSLCKSDSSDQSSQRKVAPQGAQIPPYAGTRRSSAAANAANALKMSKEVNVSGDQRSPDQGRNGTRRMAKTRKLKMRTSLSETQLDRVLRVGSLGSVNGTASLVRSIGGYQTLVAVKDAVDSTAGWRTPPLSGSQFLKRQASSLRSSSKELRPSAGNATAHGRPQSGSFEWTSPAYASETAMCLASQGEATSRGSGLHSGLATPGVADRQEVGTESSDDSSSQDDVDEVLDIQRTLLNMGLFVATIGSWKGIWDFQDKSCLWPPGPCEGGMPWWTSVTIGILVYIMRFKVDDILDTHDVHNEDWFELFSEMPELSWGTAGEYGKIYLSSGLVFVSSLFIWRGVWAGFDAAGLTWFSTLIIGALGYLVLSVLQLELEIQRAREDPDGARSPSLFAERDGLLTPLTLVPEEYKKENDSSDDEEGMAVSLAPPPDVPDAPGKSGPGDVSETGRHVQRQVLADQTTESPTPPPPRLPLR